MFLGHCSHVTKDWAKGSRKKEEHVPCGFPSLKVPRFWKNVCPPLYQPHKVSRGSAQDGPKLGLRASPKAPFFLLHANETHLTGRWVQIHCALAPQESQMAPTSSRLPTHHCAQSACTAWPGTAPPASASQFSALLGAGRWGCGQTQRSSCQHRCHRGSGGDRSTAQRRCHSPCQWSSGHRLQDRKSEPMPLPQQVRMSGKLTTKPEKPAASWNWFHFARKQVTTENSGSFLKTGKMRKGFALFADKGSRPGVTFFTLMVIAPLDDKCDSIFPKNKQEWGPINTHRRDLTTVSLPSTLQQYRCLCGWCLMATNLCHLPLQDVSLAMVCNGQFPVISVTTVSSCLSIHWWTPFWWSGSLLFWLHPNSGLVTLFTSLCWQKSSFWLGGTDAHHPTSDILF